jgi:hypothetical protein
MPRWPNQICGDSCRGLIDTWPSETRLIEKIIRLISSTLSAHDRFDSLFEGDVETPEDGVAALHAFVQNQRG